MDPNAENNQNNNQPDSGWQPASRGNEPAPQTAEQILAADRRRIDEID